MAEIVELPRREFAPVVTSDEFDIWRRLAEAQKNLGYKIRFVKIKTPEERERLGGDIQVLTDPDSARELDGFVKYCKDKEIFKVFNYVFTRDPAEIRKIIEEKVQQGEIVKDLSLLTSSYLAAYQRRVEAMSQGKRFMKPFDEKDEAFYKTLKKTVVEGKPLEPLRPGDMDGYLMRLANSAAATQSA